MGLRAIAIGLVALTALPASVARAESPAEFYKGKVVEMYIGYSVGGGYDVYARLVARHLGKHIPGNPTVVPKNMEGAGSLRLANWLYKVGAKDGTVIGTIGRGVPFDPLLERKGAQFEGNKFTYIGSANNEVSVCVSWYKTGVKTIQDAMKQQITVGGTGPAADTDQFPKIANGLLGTKFKVISGYPGGNNAVLAMERGEVQGRCGWSWSSVKATHQAWIDEKKINILVQMGLSKHPDLQNVPLITDLAKTDEERSILKLIFARQVMGRPFLAPPGVPADRVAALRTAFMETMKDPEFLADAKKTKLEINPVNGEAVEKLANEVYQTPKDICQKAGALLK